MTVIEAVKLSIISIKPVLTKKYGNIGIIPNTTNDITITITPLSWLPRYYS